VPTLEVAFETFCVCGEGICQHTTTRCSRGRRFPQVVVTPCPKCMEEMYYKGKNEGYEAAKERYHTSKQEEK
jgi:hypothetical protein